MLSKINNFIKNSALRLILGVVSIVIGFVLVIFPLVPGWWLLIIGLELLGLRLLLQKKNQALSGRMYDIPKTFKLKAKKLK